MKLAQLMGDARKMDRQGLRIQRRAIGSNALHHKVSLNQYLAKSCQEAVNIRVVGGVVQDFDQQAMELLVIDHHQDAERPIVNFVDRDIPRKLSQDIIEIRAVNVIASFFSRGFDPVLHGSSGDPDSMVSPQIPTGLAVGKSIFNDEMHGKVDNPQGILGVRGNKA